MKKYVLFLFFAALTCVATAQDFTLEPMQVDTEEPLNAENDNAGYAKVTNTSSTSKVYVWERNVVTIPSEWNSAVCDKVRCYLPHIDSQEFSMDPNEEGDMIVHVYPNQVEGEATIEVKVYEKDNPDNAITGVYNFFIGVTGVLEVTKSLTKVFPNPTTGEVNLQLWLDQPAQTQVEIQNAQGQRVALNNYGSLQGENLLNIENPGMAPGMYFVVIHLDDQLFTKKLLVK